MNQTAFNAIMKARAMLIRIQPFFATLALRLEVKEINDPSIPVMGTDGQYLYYNPKGVLDLAEPEIVGVIIHEVLHCAFQHMFRRHHRKHDKWNQACDYVINSIILQERFSLPEGRLFNRKFDGQSAEEIYDKLPDPSSKGGAGNGATGWDFGASIDPGTDKSDEGKSRSPSEVAAMAKDWEIATKQAAHIAKSQGTLPGYLGTLIDELLQPQIPWRQQLWRFFNQRVPDRHSWNKPNRRLISSGTYIPSRTKVPTGDVVIAVDTSGSVSDEELQLFASEIQEIHKSLQPRKLYVADVDTEIKDRVKEYGPYDTPVFEYHGRGGTAFEPVFEWVEENNIQCDALVYLTDGYASWPEHEPNYPVLWVITNHERKPAWGEHLTLELDQ